MAKKATRFLADLISNVDALYEGRIDDETFKARQTVTWDAIREAGPAIEEMVLRALRDQMPPARRAR